MRSHVVSLRGANCCRSGLLPPPPPGNLRHIVSVPGDERLVVDKLVADGLLGVGSTRSKRWNTIDYVAYEVEAIEIVEHAHVKGRCRGALFLVATHMDVVMARTPVGQPMDQPRIAVESEDDWLISREQRVEIVIGQAVRVFARGLQLHQIDDI